MDEWKDKIAEENILLQENILPEWKETELERRLRTIRERKNREITVIKNSMAKEECKVDNEYANKLKNYQDKGVKYGTAAVGLAAVGAVLGGIYGVYYTFSGSGRYSLGFLEELVIAPIMAVLTAALVAAVGYVVGFIIEILFNASVEAINAPGRKNLEKKHDKKRDDIWKDMNNKISDIEKKYNMELKNTKEVYEKEFEEYKQRAENSEYINKVYGLIYQEIAIALEKANHAEYVKSISLQICIEFFRDRIDIEIFEEQEIDTLGNKRDKKVLSKEIVLRYESLWSLETAEQRDAVASCTVILMEREMKKKDIHCNMYSEVRGAQVRCVYKTPNLNFRKPLRI